MDSEKTESNLSIMDQFPLLDIFDKIARTITDWETFALNIGVGENVIENIKRFSNSTFSNCSLALRYHYLYCEENKVYKWSAWKNFVELNKESRKIINNIEDELKGYFDEGMPQEIAKNLKDWKVFATHLDLEYHEINLIENDYQSIEEKCFRTMCKAVLKLNSSTETGWPFWREKLSSFEDGRKAIRNLESYRSDICPKSNKEDSLTCHLVISDEMIVKFHHYNIDEDFQILRTDEQKTVKINTGDNNIKVLKKEEFDSWIDTERNLFHQIADYCEIINDQCLVMQTLQIFLEMNSGFAIKGFDHNMFSFCENSSKETTSREDIVAYVFDENLLLHIAFANKENICEVMNGNIHTIQLIRSTYECLQNINTTYVAVVLLDDSLSETDAKVICEECSSLQLIIPQHIFENIDNFKTWYKNTIACNNELTFCKTSALNYKEESEKIEMQHKFMENILILANYQHCKSQYANIFIKPLPSDTSSPVVVEHEDLVIEPMAPVTSLPVVDIKNEDSVIEPMASDTSSPVDIKNKDSVPEKTIKNVVEENNQNVSVIHEIANRISQWRVFGRILNLEDSFLNQLQTDCRLSSQRNHKIIERFSLPLQPNPSWAFWRQFLDEFHEGKLVIEEMEETFFGLLSKIPNTVAHIETSDRLTYVGHPFQYFNNDNLTLDKEDNIIRVQVGSNECQIVDYQNFSEWIETQKHYMDTYNMLKDLKTFNFVSDNMCPILQTLKNYLDAANDSGFVIKGYNFVNHFCLFKPNIFSKDVFNDSYFCFLENDNVVLYLTKCSKGACHALHHSLRNVQIANILHSDLQSNKITQINVIIHDQTTGSTKFCKQCIVHNLFVHEETFTDVETFTLWYNKVIADINIQNKINQPNDLLMTGNEIGNAIKKDMITYQALETRNLPSFSYCPEDQMDELKNLVVLSPNQFKALHSNKKNILLRGSYGCGKSLVLFKKFELIVNNMIDSEIVYLICNDQQSKFIQYMKTLESKYCMKNIIICRSDQLMPGAKIIPKLSCILNHIKHVWKDKTVHILIDEFTGSYFTNTEIEKLKNILHNFQHSYIIIALQSMEQNIVGIENSRTVFSDFGYQFSKLTEKTSFTCFNLDYSLRNSSEINEFVKATASILESSLIYVAEKQYFARFNKFIVDSECGMEYSGIDLDKEATMVTAYKYNQNDSVGHGVKSGLVNVYHCSSKDSDKRIIYLSTLEYILNDVSDMNKYVICTYDKYLYHAVTSFLGNSLHSWTYHINDFIQPKSIFSVLITDYAAVRGYEFNNFIFLAPLGNIFLKYRMLECFTRCTTRLHIISDEVNVTKDSIDHQLIMKWKELNCVYFVDWSYDESADTVWLVHNDTEIHCTENAREVYSEPSTYGSLCNDPFDISVIKVEDTSNVQDDILIGLRYIVSMDNIRLLNDFVNLHNTDIRTYRDIDYQNLLHIASEYDAVCISQILINDYKIDVNWTDKYKRTPLYLAADHGSTKTVDILIKNGADVNANGKYNNTPLHESSRKRYLSHAERYFTNDKYKNIPLHISSREGHINIVQLLLDNGADVNANGKCYNTPLHESSRKGHINIVQLLLDNGADVNVKNKDGCAAVNLAQREHHEDIVELLKRYK